MNDDTKYLLGALGIVFCAYAAVKVWRMVLVTFFSVIINKLTEYDQSLYWILFISCLSYFLISFVINLVFLYGIYRERRHFMLPYIAIVALEIVAGGILAGVIVILFFSMRSTTFAIYVILIGLFILAVHFTLWLQNIFFYKELEYKSTMKKNKRRNTSLSENSLDNL